MSGAPEKRAKSRTAAAAARPTRARAFARGTDAHYEDADHYDRTYRRRREDVRFYVQYAAERGGPVLELGVGTGRVAAELAREGLDVVGVDRMAPMLARARARIAALPRAERERVTLVRGDLTRLALGRRFPLVISPFNVLMHLYSRRDWERALAGVCAHLAPSGRFVFDVLLPYPAALARSPARLYRAGTVTLRGRRHRYSESFHYDPVTQVQLVQMVFEDESDRRRPPVIVPLAHRQIFPAELEALLHYNGLEIVDRWGDFARGPLVEQSESQVIVAKLRRTRR